MVTSKPLVVNCPRCSARVVWDSSNAHRPFCSERCKMSDLGAWASESYRIPVAEDKDEPDAAQDEGPR